MRRHGRLLLLSFMFALMVFDSRKVQAGTISSPESKVLAAVYEIYVYNGESYKALPEYAEQVREYLQQDDVDLTEDECNELLGMIDANLQTAVEGGYFVKVTESDTQPDDDKAVTDTEQSSDTHYMDNPGSPDTDADMDAIPDGNEADTDIDETDDKNSNNTEDDETISGDNTGEVNSSIQSDTGDETQETENSGRAEVSSDNEIENSGETENPDNSEDSEVLSQDIEMAPEKPQLSDAEDVFGFWYQADAERRKKETNTVTVIAVVLCVLIVLCYAARQLYRHYVLYLSHPKASSKWKPEHLSDMHCHLIPGVDDGSMNMAMTRKLLQMEIENGVDTILFTPHFKRGKSRFNNEKLYQVFEEVKQEAWKMKPGMKLYLGEELYYDHSLCQAIEEGRALKLNNTDYVLVEFSPDVDYKTIHKACQKLVMTGVVPVLAHIERYPALISKAERLEEVHELGVYYQMNVTSIMGNNFSTRVYKQRKLMADGWIDIVGSDSHDDKNRTPKFKKAWKELLRLCDDEMVERIMWENPARLLAGKDMEM